MLLADYVAEQLSAFGVRHVFGYQGSNIAYTIDAICRSGDLAFVECGHEQGAAFAAGGCARALGGRTPGVALASSGPGALNLVTGIADAYFDSIPAIFITGDLSSLTDKGNGPCRQQGFQSTDIVSIVRPITKYAEKLKSPEDIRYCLEKMHHEAFSGRPGPVLLAIPHYMQRTEIDPAALRSFVPPIAAAAVIAPAELERAAALLAASRRPLLLLGAGAVRSSPELAAWLDRLPLPAVSSLGGLNVLSHDHSAFVGFIGDFGNRHANLALAGADLLLVLGSRLDERQLSVLKKRTGEPVIIQVDIDRGELFRPRENYLPICGDVGSFLAAFTAVAEPGPGLGDWRRRIGHWRRKYSVLPPDSDFNANLFLRRLSEKLPAGALFFADVGMNQMCAAQALRLTGGKKLFNSGGLGAMGFALPAALGAALAAPERKVVCICGDGGMQMNLQELQTVAREKVDLKIVVLNNRCLGMIRDFQDRVLGGRHFASVDGYASCDWRKVAAAFDLDYAAVETAADLAAPDALFASDRPALIEVRLPEDMTAYPAGLGYPLSDEEEDDHEKL